jgi:anaerobic glycerol-3-phosphate dehydrogenase
MTKSKKRLGAEVHSLPSLLPPLLGIRVHTIDLDDRGALCQVGSDDDLQKVSEKRREELRKMRTGTVMSSFTC